jgi:predicted  nucleic acid-binding Zn-ribbon protein
VSAEWFVRLKEYDSLTKMRLSHLKAIDEQESRLKTLNVKRQEQLQLAEEAQAKLRNLQQAFYETEKKMKTSEEQAQRLRDIGGDDSKIQIFVQDAAQLEDKLFFMMDEQEKIQSEFEDAKTFLTGLEKTISEIKAEVDMEVADQKQKVVQAQMRIKLIEDELPTDFKSVLERTLKKNLALGPFTRNENGSCFFCRYKISKLDESEIDMQKQLKTCPQCSRIFLPYGI